MQLVLTLSSQPPSPPHRPPFKKQRKQVCEGPIATVNADPRHPAPKPAPAQPDLKLFFAVCFLFWLLFFRFVLVEGEAENEGDGTCRGRALRLLGRIWPGLWGLGSIDPGCEVELQLSRLGLRLKSGSVIGETCPKYVAYLMSAP